MKIVTLLFIFIFCSCSTPNDHRVSVARHVASLELKDLKQTVYERHSRANDLDSLPVRWVSSEVLSEMTENIRPEQLKDMVIRYAAKDSDYAEKVAYFSYNRFLRFYLNRAQTQAQLDAIDELFQAASTELVTGQNSEVGVDKLLVNGQQARPNRSHRQMMNEMVQSDRLMHLLHTHLEVIVANESGPEKFKELFKATQRLAPVREYLSFHGNSSASSSSWIFSEFRLAPTTKMIRETAKNQRTFDYVTDLLKNISIHTLLATEAPYDQAWQTLPNLAERHQRQAYGLLYYTLANKHPLKDNFLGAMGNEHTFRMRHREVLMKQRRENLTKALSQIDFSYFRSADDIEALNESLRKFESVDELVFHWKNITHGESLQGAKYRLHAKLRHYGLVSELTNKYLLLPKYVQEVNKDGPRSAPENFTNIGRGRLNNAWEVELDNIGGYESKEKGLFYIHHSSDVFDDLMKGLDTQRQSLAFEALIDKLNQTQVELSLYSSRTSRMPTFQYLLHEISSPIEEVSSQWLRYTAIDKKSSGVIFPIRMMASNSQAAMWLIFFEKRMIELIEDQSDLDAYLRLTTKLNLNTELSKINKLNEFLTSHPNAKPVHIEHILDHWEEFNTKEKISLTPEFMDEHLRLSRQASQAVQNAPIPETIGPVAPRSKSCFEIIGQLLRF